MSGRCRFLATAGAVVFMAGTFLSADETDPRVIIEQQAVDAADPVFCKPWDSSVIAPIAYDGTYATPEAIEAKQSAAGQSEIDEGSPRGGPIPNDLCANAIPVTNGTFPIDTVGATSSGPTETFCNFGFADGANLNSDIWYSYLAPYQGRVSISLCGSGYDTKMAVYERDCPTGANTCIACDDDRCNPGVNFQSAIIFDAQAGITYFIRIGGFNGAQGTGSMTISSGEAPVNDECAAAIDLPCEANVEVDNTFATTSPTDPPIGCFLTGARRGYGTVWYKFVSPHGSVQIKTCNTLGTQNTMVALYDGQSGCPTQLQELGCGEDECGRNATICIGSIVPGRTYYIQLATCDSPYIAQASPGICQVSSRGLLKLELACPCPVGPDVIVGALFGEGTGPSSPSWNIVKNFGRVAAQGITAYSTGTYSCNPGDVEVQWNATNNKHPVIGQQLYRLKNGRMEQIGMSWVKHGFLALTEDICQLGCLPPNPFTGATLGVGCADPYGSDLNGQTTRLGPRGHINAFTGSFPYPFNTGVPFPPPGPPATIGRRLQVKDADLSPALNPPLTTKYYIEGHYITSDDATLGNGLNNASTREVLVSNPSGNTFNLTMINNTFQMHAGISLWHMNDPSVVETIIEVPAEGRFMLAAKATDLGNGNWNYEYALYNYNSDRSGQSVSVPVPTGVAVTNVGFHDVDYHSGDSLGSVSGAIENTDWTPTVGASSVTWATTPYATNVKANALRWATLYNYRFDAAASPTTGNLTIGLFKPGSPTSISGSTLVPAPPVLVNFNLTPSMQSVVESDTVEVTLSLTAQGASSGPVSKVDAILNWDPALLEFLEYDVTGAGYSWATHGFPVDPDGLNVSLSDGRAMFEVTATSGSPASAPPGPGSLEVAKFRFRALVPTVGTQLTMLPTEVIDQSRVIGAGTGDIRTGSMAGAVNVEIVPDEVPTLTLGRTVCDDCVVAPQTVTVNLSVSHLTDPINGIQALLHYDPAVLGSPTVLAGDGAGSPWDAAIVTPFENPPGDISLGFILIGTSSPADAVVARLEFPIVGSGTTQIEFRAGQAPFFTKLTVASDNSTILPLEVLAASFDAGIAGRVDMNGDGQRDGADIQRFVEVLLAPGAASAAERCAADTNVDGSVTFDLDVAPFVDCLLTEVCPCL